MTKDAIPFMDFAALNMSEAAPVSLDPFAKAAWRDKLAETSDGAITTVTLSSGKTVTVETRFLRFLRALAAELASKEPPAH